MYKREITAGSLELMERWNTKKQRNRQLMESHAWPVSWSDISGQWNKKARNLSYGSSSSRKHFQIQEIMKVNSCPKPRYRAYNPIVSESLLWKIWNSCYENMSKGTKFQDYCLFLIVETIVSLHKIRVIIKRRKGAQGLTVRPLGSS